MKTDDLTGAALDWAVAKCEGVEIIVRQENWDWYSTDWAQGGPIMEREKIATAWHLTRWVAWRGVIEHPGPTPLIAAMRCYVAAKLGDDIEIPEELNQGESK
jgi:hypothetical protein